MDRNARICVGIKATGHRCDKRVALGERRCATHRKTIETNGPNATAVKELVYTHKRAGLELAIAWNDRINAEVDQFRKQELQNDFIHEANLLKINQNREKDLLIRQQQDEVRRTGVDPDAEAIRRREERDRLAHEEFERRRNLIIRNEQVRIAAIAGIVQAREQEHRAAAQAAPRGELEAFARDAQNVHTAQTVNATKDMVTLILGIPVPDEYKWNSASCSKTPGDIIMTCKLSPKAAWQMTAKYCQDESIYDLGTGIYGKVLDGVWQFILRSSDKDDICRILKQEMEDNIGMCAQGNLSRLCNILAGYMEGIGSQESVGEVLGRLMPRLLEIEDLDVRLAEAYKILKDNKVPVSQWKVWLDPLLIDQDVDMQIGFIRNAADEITGFMAVAV